MAEKSILDLPPEERGYPGDNTLKKRALEQLSKTEARQLREKGTLDAYLAHKVEAVQSYGRSLISMGLYLPEEAWRVAERVEILGLPES